MSSNVVNQMPYLRTSRNFPPQMDQLVVEINKDRVDIANAVNNRVIAIFPTMRPAITGEAWFLKANQKQQGTRQVYTFTSTTSINHGVMVVTPSQFIRCWGTFTDGTNTYGLPFLTTVAVAGQISFYVTSTQIVFVTGAGAPTLTSGQITLEWISQP